MNGKSKKQSIFIVENDTDILRFPWRLPKEEGQRDRPANNGKNALENIWKYVLCQQLK